MSRARDRRDESLAILAQLGLELPREPVAPLEEGRSLRSLDSILDRLVALNACVAASYGLDPAKALGYLGGEDALDALTQRELAFLEDPGSVVRESLRERVEALWALAWVTRHQEVLLPTQGCSAIFVKLLPHPGENDTAAFRARARLRDLDRVLQALDAHIVLRASLEELRATGGKIPRTLVPDSVLEQRWRALDWCASERDWE